MKNLEKEREQKKIFYRDWECGIEMVPVWRMPTTFWVNFRWTGLKFMDSN
jgi:hypothetical protein